MEQKWSHWPSEANYNILSLSKEMANNFQDPNYPILNHLYNPLLYGNWPCYPYFYYPTQIIQSLCPQKTEFDESFNDFIQIKKEQKNQTLQILPQPKELNPKTKDSKKKSLNNKIQDHNYMNKCQKGDRNLNSIVIRNFANFVNGHPSLLKTVETIILKRNLTISAQEFKKRFKESFPSRQPYVGVGKLKKFIENGKQNRDVRVITLILLRKFISIDFFTVMLNSRKVSQSAKEKELKHGKKFWKEFSLQYL